MGFYINVSPEGFEPSTASLEGRCSIQLSYEPNLMGSSLPRTDGSLTHKKARISSGWQDSNLRPPRPKRGAITGLRYTPKFFFKRYCGETGIRTLGTRCGVRRFSKPLLSATQAPLLFNELP